MKKNTIAITTHTFYTGPAQILEEYLYDKVSELIFIGHPFPYSIDRRSHYRKYVNGIKIDEGKMINIIIPSLFTYFKDFLYSMFWLIRYKHKIDIYIGSNAFNAFIGILFKKIHIVNKTIYYVIDYVPKRFNNRIINRAYHWIESYSALNSDFVWNLSKQMVIERSKKGVFNNNNIIVPIGVHFKRIKRKKAIEVEQKKLVFMGHLRKYQGLELIISTMPELINIYNDIKLVIIGTGPIENILKKMVKTLNIENWVIFMGFINDHRDLENLLCECGIGLSLYEPNKNSFTWFADPSKPKQYMACGLPQIITKVARTSKIIKHNKMGVVINYNKEELIDAVKKLISEKDYYMKCRNNSIKYAETIDWDYIYKNAFKKSSNV